MTLIYCRECASSISDSAIKCPGCGFQFMKLKRGFFGKLFKLQFIVFNMLMFFILFSYMGEVSELSNTGEISKTSAAVGGFFGTGMILTLWFFTDIFLGLLVLLTRPKLRK